MMPSTVVQFRIDATVLAELRALGLKPNEVAKAAFLGRVRLLKTTRMLDFFQAHPAAMVGGRPVDALIREMRDAA